MKLIKERLIASVVDETGIRLTAKDLQITADSGDLKVTLWDNELLNLSYEDGDLEDDDFAEEVVDELFHEHYDLREKIVELKLEDLNSDYLPAISDGILSLLEASKVDERLLDVMDFEFVDLGYNLGNFSNASDEEWNYPHIALRVTDFEDLEHFIPVDPYKDPSNLDLKTISSEIIKKIRGKI